MTMRQLLSRLQSGNPIQWDRIALEQAVEVAAIGEEFAEECDRRERAADRQIAKEFQREEFYDALGGR